MRWIDDPLQTPCLAVEVSPAACGCARARPGAVGQLARISGGTVGCFPRPVARTSNRRKGFQKRFITNHQHRNPDLTLQQTF